MEVRDFPEKSSGGINGTGLPDAWMADKEYVEIGIKRRGGLQVHLLFKNGADGCDRGPLAEDGGGFEVVGVGDEGFDEAVFERTGSCSV